MQELFYFDGGLDPVFSWRHKEINQDQLISVMDFSVPLHHHIQCIFAVNSDVCLHLVLIKQALDGQGAEGVVVDYKHSGQLFAPLLVESRHDTDRSYLSLVDGGRLGQINFLGDWITRYDHVQVRGDGW